MFIRTDSTKCGMLEMKIPKDKMFAELEKHVRSHNDIWFQVFSIGYEALMLANEILGGRHADDIVSANNEARSGPTRLLDLQVEQLLFTRLSAIDIYMVSEESNYPKPKSAKYFVIVDPIDGTDVAVRGIKFYAVNLAFGKLNNGQIYHSEIEFATVLSPQGIFYAGKNFGAFENGQPISVRNNCALDNAIVRMPRSPSLPDTLAKNILTGINFGSTGVELCYLARGSIDCYIETKLRKVFDYAAPAFIVLEAGGMVCDIGGNQISPNPISSSTSSTLLVSSTKELFHIILQELNAEPSSKYMKNA